MADQPDDSEKTEDPTQKKLEDAHKKGDVAKSQEVNTWFVLFAATMVVAMFSQDMASGLSRALKVYLAQPHQIPIDGEHLRVVTTRLGVAVAAAVGLPLLALMVAAVIGNMVQHRLLLTAETIKPKLNKISPLAGAKRLFSAQSLVNFAKGLVKVGVVGTLIVLIVWPRRNDLALLVSSDPSQLLLAVVSMTLQVMAGVLAVMAIVAALDFAYQHHVWSKKQRMTLKELRDEFKQMEGDPAVRAKLRQIRIERGRKRMMSSVPRASVIITNPTHYAVALQYEEGMNAPLCLAKGVDTVALKIREIGKQHDIPIVENPPLARALHATTDIDHEIDPEHYQAVAQVISYIMTLRRKAGKTRR